MIQHMRVRYLSHCQAIKVLVSQHIGGDTPVPSLLALISKDENLGLSAHWIRQHEYLLEIFVPL